MMLFIIRIIGTFLLKLRYRVKVNGLDKVKKGGNKGILFLPNHPRSSTRNRVGHIDKRLQTQGACVKSNRINRSVLRKSLRLSRFRHRDRRKGSIEKVDNNWAMRQLLAHGDNVLFYPAGRIYSSRYENSRKRRVSGCSTCIQSQNRPRPHNGTLGISFGRSSDTNPHCEILLDTSSTFSQLHLLTPSAMSPRLVGLPATSKNGTKEESTVPGKFTMPPPNPIPMSHTTG